jgi:hypothetical protein
MEIQDKTKDELITELNELLKTNYLKVQNETLTAELLVKMKNCFPKKRARLSVNHSQQGLLSKKKENRANELIILKKLIQNEEKEKH